MNDKSEAITASIEDVARYTLNIPIDEIERALEAGSLRIDGKPIKAKATVTIAPGAMIVCRQTKVQIIEPHLVGLRQFVKGGPKFELSSQRKKR